MNILFKFHKWSILIINIFKFVKITLFFCLYTPVFVIVLNWQENRLSLLLPKLVSLEALHLKLISVNMSAPMFFFIDLVRADLKHFIGKNEETSACMT